MTQLEAICHWPVMYGECVRILGKQWGYKDTFDRLHCHSLRNYEFLKYPPYLRDCSLLPTLSTLLILFVRLVVRLSETM